MLHFINNFDYELNEPWPAGASTDIPLPVPALALIHELPADAVLNLTLGGPQVNEVVAVEWQSGVLSFTRGQEGTSDQLWPAGTRVYAAVTAGACSTLAAGDPVAVVVGGENSSINWHRARRWIVNIQGDTTLSLAPAPTGAELDVLCVQDDVGGHVVDLPSGVIWPRGSEDSIVDGAPGSVTRCMFTSVGPRWIGDLKVYGEVPPQELFALYIHSGGSGERATGQYFLLRSVDGTEVFGIRNRTDTEYDTFSAFCAVSADNQYAAVYTGYGSPEPHLSIFNLKSAERVDIDMRLPVSGPERTVFQFVDGVLHVWAGGGLTRINPVTGVRSTVALAGVGERIQSFSVATDMVAVTYNGTTVSAFDRVPVVLYDLATGGEHAEQLPLPPGALLAIAGETGPSPYGAVGAFSGDGKLYALCTRMMFGDDHASATEQVKLVIYEVASRSVLHVYDMPLTYAYSSGVVWSRSGRYVAASHDGGVDSGATVVDLQNLVSTVVGDASFENSPFTVSDDGLVVVSREGAWLVFSVATGAATGWPAWMAGMDEVVDGWQQVRALGVASAWR